MLSGVSRGDAGRSIGVRLAALGERRSRMPRTIVYAPDQLSGSGLASWAEMGRQLWAARDLAWRLFTRDLAAGYRESVLGYIWAVFPTLATAAIFTWLSQTNLLSVQR